MCLFRLTHFKPDSDILHIVIISIRNQCHIRRIKMTIDINPLGIANQSGNKSCRYLSENFKKVNHDAVEGIQAELHWF